MKLVDVAVKGNRDGEVKQQLEVNSLPAWLPRLELEQARKAKVFPLGKKRKKGGRRAKVISVIMQKIKELLACH
jgi:hypothetical protein